MYIYKKILTRFIYDSLQCGVRGEGYPQSELYMLICIYLIYMYCMYIYMYTYICIYNLLYMNI